MSPTERAIRQFRQRYPLATEADRYSDRLEMAIRYDDLEALYAAPDQEARVVTPTIEQPAESANPLPQLSAGGDRIARANLALNAGIWCNGAILVVLALREVL